MRRKNCDETKKKNAIPAVQLFGRICTFQFKRLPLLGSFVNGLFLAALLMSAAIEGIQTCFHAGHLISDGQKSILMEHPVTYPSVLVGFAVVGIIMQWCSVKAHQMREEELESASLLDLRSENISPEELNVSQLSHGREFTAYSASLTNREKKRNSISLRGKSLVDLSAKRKYFINSTRHESLESIPIELENKTSVSLRSLKLCRDIDIPNFSNSRNIKSISKNVEEQVEGCSSKRDEWLIIRYCASPAALVTCALIVYFVHNELVTEIADAFLAILVVVILFAGSYPPMKKASRVLLQTAPDGVDLDLLKEQLLALDEAVIEVEDLHVWGLTPRSNRVATCRLVLDKTRLTSERQLVSLLGQARFKFLQQNIKCSSIQPTFYETPSEGNKVDEVS